MVHWFQWYDWYQWTNLVVDWYTIGELHLVKGSWNILTLSSGWVLCRMIPMVQKKPRSLSHEPKQHKRKQVRYRPFALRGHVTSFL